MGYFLIDIETYNDGSAQSKAIYTYTTQDEAIAAYHSKLGVAMKNLACQTCMCKVISEVGSEIRSEYWMRAAQIEV